MNAKDHFRAYLQNKALIHPEHLTQLMELVSSQEIPKDTVLLRQGQLCQHNFFVGQGLLRMYSIDDQGKEHIVQFAPENWFLSDRESLYFSNPSNYFIDAIEDSSVVLFTQDFIESASSISKEFRTYNEYLLQNHIRQLQNRIQLLIGAPAAKRYENFLHLYPNISRRVPQWMIASYLGITPEGLSRVRKQITQANN